MLLLRFHMQFMLHDRFHNATPSVFHPLSVQIVFITCASFEGSDLILMLARSCLTVCIQVVFGL